VDDGAGGGRVSDPYIPSRIRGGARPSVSDCVGCPDREIRRYSYRKIRICGVTGTTFRQTLQCPKLSSPLTAPPWCLGCPHPIYDDRKGEWDWYCRQHSPTGIRCNNVAVLRERCYRVRDYFARKEAMQ
jgi:hypothetical protein